MRHFERVKGVLSTAVVIYAAAAAIIFFLADHKKAAIERLNTVAEWGDYPMRQGPVGERPLRLAVRYYKLVAEVLPQSDQPLAMIGYCYAMLREDRLAVKYYQQALRKQPSHFWQEYNLGVLYFRGGDFSRAAAAFQKVAALGAEDAARSAILAPLARMPSEQRQFLFGQAVKFALELRERGAKMAVAVGVPEARQAISPEAIPVVMHPWAYSIGPGKENYF